MPLENYRHKCIIGNWFFFSSFFFSVYIQFRYHGAIETNYTIVCQMFVCASARLHLGERDRLVLGISERFFFVHSVLLFFSSMLSSSSSSSHLFISFDVVGKLHREQCRLCKTIRFVFCRTIVLMI